MKFSTRTVYGLKAVLVLAGRFGEGSLSVSQIAAQEGISIPYLEQILNALKKKGLVKSVRGPQGGYVLAKSPVEITFGGLLTALEGDNFFKAVSSFKSKRGSASQGVSVENLFWSKFESALNEKFSKTTLKSLMDEFRKQHKVLSQNSTFHI